MAQSFSPGAGVSVSTPRVARRARQPVHNFAVKHQPFAIQPFMIAPVIPGESLDNLLLQSRAVTKPILNSIRGWWLEYYIFYVQHRDLPGSADFQNMMIVPGHSMAAQAPGGTNAKYYNNLGASGIDWVGQCLRRVVEEYFREEHEAWNDYLIDGLPAAAINGNSFWDSARLRVELGEGGDLGDIETAAEDVTIRQLEDAYLMWEHMRALQLTQMSYEDYLKSHGVRGKEAEDPTRPELIRYVRDWQYPSNTVNPADVLDGEDEIVVAAGTPSSAVSWGISERADKRRFFSEPGFIFGVTVLRPKVLMAKQKSSLVQFMDRPFDWMPAILATENPQISIKEFAAAGGPAGGNLASDYVIDMRDLLMYGDQFLSFNPDTATDGTNAIDLPVINATPTPDELVKFYPTEAMVDALFVDGDATDAISQDGVVRLSIQSVQRDIT